MSSVAEALAFYEPPWLIEVNELVSHFCSNDFAKRDYEIWEPFLNFGLACCKLACCKLACRRYKSRFEGKWFELGCGKFRVIDRVSVRVILACVLLG